jgi:Ca2+-binding RTX toxin-like protein
MMVSLALLARDLLKVALEGTLPQGTGVAGLIKVSPKCLALAERACHLILQWLDQVFERRTRTSLDEHFGWHARDQLQTLQQLRLFSRPYSNAGVDTLAGAKGQDVYVIHNSADTIIENVGEGHDTVMADVSFTLPANVEDLILSGSANLTGTGNTLDNWLLISDSSVDTLVGGDGQDVYVAHNSSVNVVETSSGGYDAVIADVNFTLPANVETLVLSGSGNLNGGGNGLDNVIYANSGNDMLTGGGGHDTFNFSQPFGHDQITDFTADNASSEHDLIDLSGRGLTYSDLTITASGADTLIQLASGQSILLQHVLTSAIDSGDFLF